VSDPAAFGDWDPDDSVDTEPAAPEQVTYKLHALRLEVDALAGAAGLPTWDELDAPSQELALAMGDMIVAFLVANEPDDPELVARQLHEARRYVASSRLRPWDELDADDRAVGVDLMSLILGWLRRQGALP
jgi:hypothetical protein